MIDYKEICETVCEVAKEAGEFIRRERESFSADRIEYKGAKDMVSYVDKGAEQMIVQRLKAVLPEASFITEEHTVSTDESARYKWIIDPLDGTTNFIHGFPPYCVSIALADGNDIVVGVVYEITIDECFYAWKDGGAYLNGKPIRVSETASLADSLVITGVAYSSDDLMDMFLGTFKHFLLTTHGARRIGSAATDLVYVAAGRAEAFWQMRLSAWDVAAGALIVCEAGGTVTDFSGGNDYIFGREIIATNKATGSEFRKTLGDLFAKYNS